MLYSLNKQLTPPTCITHTTQCHFTSTSTLDLITITSNILTLSRLVPVPSTPPSLRLELLHEFHLQGTITSLAPIILATSNGLASLLITFNDAKMSLVEYSVANQDLVTVSMHNYEEKESERDGKMSMVRVDHEGRCALMLFGGCKFAILPFKDRVEDGDENPFYPSYVVGEREIDGKIGNIIDFVFLFGYQEPTLAILYERHQTFVGRLASLKDTVSLIVVSLDVFQKKYPVLYRVDGLPYNCTHLEAVPSPIGGVMVFSHNAVIHIDQTHTPGFAALVNPFFDLESHFKAVPDPDGLPVIPVRNQAESVYIRVGKYSDCKELGISLDGCHSTFLSPDVVVVVLRSGELVKVELIGDSNSGRGFRRKRGGVRNIAVSRLGLTVCSPSCLTSLIDFKGFHGLYGKTVLLDGLNWYTNYFFVGSIVSDAMLIQYFQQIPLVVKREVLVDELDEELYGDSIAVEEEASDVYKFKVSDRMLVTGPLRNIAVGVPSGCDEGVLEVVACGGHESHGSLLVMQESIRPLVMTTFPLKAEDMWSLKGDHYHSYIVISTDFSTSVLQTGSVFEEMTSGGFYRDGPTVCVSVCLDWIVQVYPNGVLLLSLDGAVQCLVEVGTEERWVVSSCTVDSVVALLYNDGQLELYAVDSGVLKKLPFSLDKVLCCSLYTDHFTLTLTDTKSNTKLDTSLDTKSNTKMDTKSDTEMNTKMDLDLDDDDDDDLYSKGVQSEQFQYDKVDETTQRTKEKTKRKFLFVIDEANTLTIHMLPSMREVFKFDGINKGFRFMSDMEVNDDDGLLHQDVEIEEMLVVNLGADKDRNYAYLMLRNSLNDVLIYKIMSFKSIPIDTLDTLDNNLNNSLDRLEIRLVRINHTLFSRQKKAYEDDDKDVERLNKKEPLKFIKKSLFKEFRGVGGYDGVVLTGEKPIWLMVALEGFKDGVQFTGPLAHTMPKPSKLSSSNSLRLHPMAININTFCPLHNINLKNGFAYITNTGLFRICLLKEQFNYDRDWGVCKVELQRCAQKIGYHVDTMTYVLATSTKAVFEVDKARYMAAVAAGVIADGEELPETEKRVSDIQDVIQNREKGMYLPEINLYQLELISPITWETVDIIRMAQFEQILTLKVVELSSKENTSGKKMYVALGTGFMRSEELSCRGRLVVYDVIDVVPLVGRPQTDHKLKPFFTSDEKNPVTALCACSGYLLAAVGTKIIMYAMDDGELNGVAFLDVDIYVVSLSAVKNFIVIADAFKSVMFVAFQEDPAKLQLLAKDLYPVQVFGTEFISTERELAILVSDDQKNLHVMAYEPYAVQSQGGLKLLRRGEMNLGHELQAFTPLRLKHQPLKMGVIAGTSEGGLSMTIPIDEKLFRRLYALYSRMVTHLPHHAGLNPRGYRQIKLPVKSIHSSSVLNGPPGPRGVLDGDMVFRFMGLSECDKEELSKAIGTRSERVMDDLLEVGEALEYF